MTANWNLMQLMFVPTKTLNWTELAFDYYKTFLQTEVSWRSLGCQFAWMEGHVTRNWSICLIFRFWWPIYFLQPIHGRHFILKDFRCCSSSCFYHPFLHNLQYFCQLTLNDIWSLAFRSMFQLLLASFPCLNACQLCATQLNLRFRIWQCLNQTTWNDNLSGRHSASYIL